MNLRGTTFLSIHGVALFWLVAILHALPLLDSKLFPTLDGPAHLYNANLVLELLSGNSAVLDQFFVFNTVPVPNWIGHATLAMLQLMMPAWLAEKCLLLFYVFGLPFAFRAFVRSLSTERSLLVYLIFPFIWSFLFFLGFYNFILGQVFFFIAFRYWMLHRNSPSIWRMLSISGLFLLVYFSHLFIFGILCGSVALYLSADWFLHRKERGTSLKSLIISGGKSFLLFAPGLLLVVIYMASRSYVPKYNYVSFAEKLEWLTNIRSIIALNFLEGEYTSRIFMVIALLTGLALAKWFVAAYRQRQSFTFRLQDLLTTSSVWFLLLITLLVAYFVLPDSDGIAGYITLRILIFVFYIALIWLCLQRITIWIEALAVITVLISSGLLLNYYQVEMVAKKSIANQILALSEYTFDDSVVLPINRTGNWYFGHCSNYIATEKRVVVLENYECDNDFYPLRWREEKMPNVLFGINPITSSYLYWKTNETGQPRAADFILTMGNDTLPNPADFEQSNRMISESYTLVGKTADCALYRLEVKPKAQQVQ